MNDLDLFVLFRTVIYLVVSAQVLSASIAWITSLARNLHGDEPGKRLLRVYLAYHLVTLNPAPLMRELSQIAACLVLLGLLWCLHNCL